MLTVEHDLMARTAPFMPGVDENASYARRTFSNADMPIILDALAQCAEAFGTERARFMRQGPDGEWIVHSLHQGSMTSHTADQAEVAMAWMVGLSRFPIRVTRPRVTQLDGSGTRPIAMTGYLGIPILCQNQFAGVIELAGSVTGDLERTLDRLGETLARLGYRLIHDPSVRAAQHVDLDVECGLAGGFWSPNEITLEEDEWAVLSVMGPSAPLHEIAARVPLPDDQLIEVIHSLVSRGLVSVRASTRILSRHDPVYSLAAAFDNGGP